MIEQRRAMIVGLVLMVMCSVVAASPAWAAASESRSGAVGFSAVGENTRIILTLPRPALVRAVIDASSASLSVDGAPPVSAGKGQGLVRRFHLAKANGVRSRLVFDLARPAVIVSVRTEGGRAVVELTPGDAIAMQAMSGVVYRADAATAGGPASIGSLIEAGGPHFLTLPRAVAPLPLQAAPAAADAQDPLAVDHAQAKPVAMIQPAPKAGLIVAAKRTIMIDPGHGGIDPGAESVAGYHEKEITLATARVLKRTLEQTGRYKVMLTRDNDIYLKLHERVARARAAHANLFVSLHADSVPDGAQSVARGASIYTLSETASDAESERYAQRENRADAIGGVDLGDQRDDVAGILVDLTVRETVNDGNRFANMLVDSMENGGVGLFPRTPHRSAGFAVLKSPDIPSVLVEMGYLSDRADSRSLADPRYQQRIANGITAGIDRYFAWVAASRS